MVISGKHFSISLLIVAVASVAATRYLWPAIETKIQTKEVIRNNVVTVIKTIKTPSGEETTTTIVDHTVKKDSTLILVAAKPQWRVGGGLGLKREYFVQIERRILGPAFLSLGADTTGSVRLGIAVEF